MHGVCLFDGGARHCWLRESVLTAYTHYTRKAVLHRRESCFVVLVALKLTIIELEPSPKAANEVRLLSCRVVYRSRLDSVRNRFVERARARNAQPPRWTARLETGDSQRCPLRELTCDLLLWPVLCEFLETTGVLSRDSICKLSW